MFVFSIITKSAVIPIIVVSKNKIYPQCILYGWSFIETQMQSESHYLYVVEIDFGQ